MLHRPRRMLGGMLTLGAVLIATIAAPGAALASSTPPTFNVVMGETCVSGAASPSTSFTLTWKNKSGSLVTRQTVTVDQFGDWSACSSGHVATDGDKIKASDGTTAHILIVPLLTISVNRVQDSVGGLAPAGSVVHIHCDSANGFEGCVWHDRVRAGANGHWSKSVPFAFAGGFQFDAAWISPDGDRVTAYGAAHFLKVVLGKPKVVGAYDANKTTTMTLFNSSMTVRGTATVTGAPADGAFSGKFRNSHGTAVAVRPGDYVQSTIASDASFTVPDISVTADVDTDVVSGRCGDGSGMDNVLVGLYRSGDRQGWANWSLESDGTFSFWFADENDFYIQPADVMHGDKLVVTCERTSGDEIETSSIVP